jgi:hypothetical protein
LRVLEIGLGLPVAYAGMVLAEQGVGVERWLSPKMDDPLQTDELVWWWAMHGKELVSCHARMVATLQPRSVDAVIDNLRPATWAGWEIDREAIARRLGIPWVSLEDDLGYRSTGAIALARSWLEKGNTVPPELAETAAGLWMAFKTLASRTRPGLHRLGHGSVMQKLVPAEMLLGKPGRVRSVLDPWMIREGQIAGAQSEWRGERLFEMTRDLEWKRSHLRSRAGRITI